MDTWLEWGIAQSEPARIFSKTTKVNRCSGNVSAQGDFERNQHFADRDNLPQMDCPNCKLVNLPTALRCDCGYDFEMHTIQRSYLTERDKKLRRGPGGAGIALLIYLVTEAVLKLMNEAVATPSFDVIALTVAMVVALLGLWVWLLKYR